MRHRLKGLHHVTATVDGAQEDLDFYAGLLGLRLVKKTVNFDNNKVYHFYYGDERGAPGTIMTTFPYRGHGVRDGVKGTGQITVTSFAVAGSSLDFWRKRLSEAGVRYKEESRFGDPLIAFDDPSTLRLELIGDDEDDRVPNAIKPTSPTRKIRTTGTFRQTDSIQSFVFVRGSNAFSSPISIIRARLPKRRVRSQ